MNENLFKQLSNVRGFNNLNGNTYQEHITKIFSNELTYDQRTKILRESTAEGALKLLEEFDIDYTHEWDSYN